MLALAALAKALPAALLIVPSSSEPAARRRAHRHCRNGGSLAGIALIALAFACWPAAVIGS